MASSFCFVVFMHVSLFVHVIILKCNFRDLFSNLYISGYNHVNSVKMLYLYDRI